MAPRRSLSEVKVRYKLAPNLNDIFVEGSYDKKILDRAHKHLAMHRPVYSIDSIEIPNEILADLGLTSGNRQRVVALCYSLEMPASSSVRCLVDTDMDELLARRLDVSGLIYTKYCDIEGAFLSTEMIEDLVVNAGKVSVASWPNLFASIEASVKKLFAIRLALCELDLHISIGDFTRCLSRQGEMLELDTDGLISRLCNFPGGHLTIPQLQEKYLVWLETIGSREARHAARGHDYLSLLSWVIRKFGGAASVSNSLEDILILLVPQVAQELVEPCDLGAPL